MVVSFLSVAGLSFRLPWSDEPTLEELLGPNWSGFCLRHEPPAIDVDMVPDSPQEPGPPHRELLLEEGGEVRWKYGPSHFLLELRSGRCRFNACNPVVLRAMLVFVTNAILLIRREGALFHGAAISHAGQGVLVLGESGAGKSTLSRLARENGARVFSDEVAAVRFCPDGAVLSGTPFVHPPLHIGEAGSAPLQVIFLLDRSRPHGTQQATPATALSCLTKNAVQRIALSCLIDPFLTAIERLVSLHTPMWLSLPPGVLPWKP